MSVIRLTNDKQHAMVKGTETSYFKIMHNQTEQKRSSQEEMDHGKSKIRMIQNPHYPTCNIDDNYLLNRS